MKQHRSAFALARYKESEEGSIQGRGSAHPRQTQQSMSWDSLEDRVRGNIRPFILPNSPLSPPVQSSSPGPAHPPLDTHIKPNLIPSTHACSEAREPAQRLPQSTLRPLMCVPVGALLIKPNVEELVLTSKTLCFPKTCPTPYKLNLQRR